MPDIPRRRVDPIRGWTSLVAPVRGSRPFDVGVDPGEADPNEASGKGRADAPGAAACPFCPGGETDLGEILDESAAVEPDQPWGSRAVSNRYPFLAAPDSAAAEAAGVQEVLIDGPEHAADPPAQSIDQRRSALRMWRARVAAALARDPEGEVHLFRNHGRDAGSSRRHPHAQLVQTYAPTPARSAMLRRLADGASCLLCADPASEFIVTRTPSWQVHVLDAPLDPGHLRIVPTRHIGSLANVSDPEIDGLADLLGPLTVATLRSTSARAYSLIVHETDPRAGRGAHLHLELRPRLSRTAGFEQSSGVGVCASDPAADAASIRRMLDDDGPIGARVEPTP